MSHRQLVVWEDGAPVVRNIPLITAPQIKDLHAAALTQLYAEPDDALKIEMGLPPSRFYGMTLIEAMLIRRAENTAYSGNSDDVERILDRELGKAVARSENHNVTESYEQVLNRIAAVENAKKEKIVNADVVEPWEQL